MEIRRFKDIIAIRSPSGIGSDEVVAFHASNLEVAELSDEAFAQMAPIDFLNGAIPETSTISENDAWNELNAWSTEKNPSVKSGKLESKIRSLTININQICNLKCQYCAAGGDGSYGEATSSIPIDTTMLQLEYFLKKLMPGDSFAVSFVGGEPLLHTQTLKALYDYIMTTAASLSITPQLKVVTNGTLLTQETLDILRDMKIHLTISFDGVKEKNDLSRSSKDGSSTTDRILSGLAKLQQSRGEIKSINFSSITTADNTDIFENYLFLKQLNPDSMEFVFANDEKSKEAQKKHIEGFEQILRYAWTAGGEKELRKIKTVDNYFNQLDSQQQIENFCGAGKSYLMVDAKNRLYTCVWDANYASEVVGAHTTINDRKISKLSKSLIELNNCQTCWARHLCGGGCMHINRSHTGNKHQKSLLFCERTRSLISLIILYYKLSRAVA